jgi:hypothetical protein
MLRSFDRVEPMLNATEEIDPTPPDVMPDMEKLMASAQRNDLEFVLPEGQ